MSLVHGVSTVTKHDKWSYNSQKMDWPLPVTLLRVYRSTCNIAVDSHMVPNDPASVAFQHRTDMATGE